jgi:hypothetical protein
MSGTSGFTSTYYFDRPIPTGTYRLICTNVRTDTSKQCQFQVVGANASEQYTNLAPIISTANYVTNEFTTTFDLYGIKVYCNTPIEITNLAIIPKALYDAGFKSYQPYSLSNAELTAKEQVNENNISYIANNSVKNLFNIATITNVASSLSISGDVVTMTTDDSRTNLRLMVQTYNDNTLLNTLYLQEITANGVVTVIFTKDATFNTLAIGHNGSTVDGKFRTSVAHLANGTEYTIAINVLECTKNPHFKWGYIMICPKSLYDGIYQSYALSNAVLTNNSSYNANNGVKNHLPINSGVTTGPQYVFDWVAKDIPAGQYIISFSTATTSGAVAIEFGDGNTASYNQTGYRVVTLPSQSAEVTVGVNTHYVRIYANVALTMSNIMLRPASIPDPTYQPYALPNTTLTSGLNSYIENGVRNFAKYNHNMASWSGVTINVSDDAVSVSGTSSSSYTGFICSGLNLLVKEPFVVKVIGTYSGFSIITQILNASGTRLYWDLSLDRTIPSGYTIEGVYMQRQSATSSVVSGNFNVLITPKAIYDLGVKDYEPYALSNAELTAQSQKVISTSGNTSKLRLTLDTTVMSNANRGSLLLSIPFQTSSYDNALLLIAIGNDSFLGVQRLDNSNNSMVTSWTLSENNTILDITLRAQPWSAPVAFPMAQVVPPITYSWES